MKIGKNLHSKNYLFAFFLAAFFLIATGNSVAENSKPFVKKIRIAGNTLIDNYDMDTYLDLGNGLTMTPEVMDMVVSELKANYHYHGYPSIEAYSILRVKNGVMTIKIDEKNEYRWGKPRAERAVLKKAFLHDISLNESKKQEIMETLLKGYQKQKKIEEIVAGFLVEKQRSRIEEIQYQRRAAMREKISDKVKEFQATKKNIEEQENRRVEEMRNRILSAGLKKIDDSTEGRTKMISGEYTDLDEFLDNVMFEEMLNPGL
jgi:outer membrane protein assembly factor BamA